MLVSQWCKLMSQSECLEVINQDILDKKQKEIIIVLRDVRHFVWCSTTNQNQELKLEIKKKIKKINWTLKMKEELVGLVAGIFQSIVTTQSKIYDLIDY